MEQQYWRKVKLAYHEVKEVEVGLRTLTLIGHEQKIKVPGELENREHLFFIIAKRLSEAGKIPVSGDNRQITKLFGNLQR